MADSAILFDVPKEIVAGDWIERGGNAGSRITCEVISAALDATKMSLRITVGVGRLDRANFHVLGAALSGQMNVTLYRLDLNQPGPHTNAFKENHPDSIRYFPPGSTHEHLGYLSVAAGMGDFATDPSRNILDFADAWHYVCERLVISNPDALPPPSPQGRLI